MSRNRDLIGRLQLAQTLPIPVEAKAVMAAAQARLVEHERILSTIRAIAMTSPERGDMLRTIEELAQEGLA